MFVPRDSTTWAALCAMTVPVWYKFIISSNENGFNRCKRGWCTLMLQRSEMPQ